ncbi:zinc-dependent metalloprotease [Chitinimonas sp.]|uniref:zinc-dependent metalloprotease n=1 Tax=Chitinimonas sp. TaxID=1934313 RepID=UPI002F93D3C0
MSSFRLRPLALALGGLLSLAVHADEDKPQPETTPAAAGTATPAARPETTSSKSFAEVTKGARRLDGYFPLWEKGDKVWLEIPLSQLDQPFFFEIGRTHGIGEHGIYGSVMGPAYVASFRRLGDKIQLLAHNLRYTAPAGSPQSFAVRQGFSDSLLASAPLASLPSSERKAILVDASALLLADIPMGAYQLESVYRQSYSFDARQSAIIKSRAEADLTALQVTAHYAAAKLSPPPLHAPGAAPLVRAPLPQTLPDARSLFLGYQYSLSRLPSPMGPRLADDRIGHFVTTRWDFGDDSAVTPRVHYVNRWRLEKRDPNAALSEPKQPIVYWLDRNIPEKYRQAVREGVLAWNLAFERIGFKNAIEVRQQEADADFDTADARHASVRWYFGVDIGSAVGPSKVDPRTGEILDADIVISDGFARGGRRFFREQRTPDTTAGTAVGTDASCDYAAEAAAELEFGLDLLAARGDLEPGGPAEERYISDVIRDVVMHEVGHTLGLRHNFRASTVYSEAQLGNKAFTHEHGIAGSVMDYSPVNLALQGQPQGEYKMLTLGDYDYWAIEYAYKPLPAEQEAKALAAIAARSTEPTLAFATDEDAGSEDDGFDPAVSRFDLGSDPLAYFEKRIKLSQELWQRLQRRPLAQGESYAVLLRGVDAGLAQVRRAAELSTKYVGGLSHLRDHAGSGREPLQPVSAETQRRALRLIAGSIFQPQSFRLSPDFVRRLLPDNLDRNENRQPVGYALADKVKSLQGGVLKRLYDDDIARRLLDFGNKAAPGGNPFTLSELYDSLQRAIWAEAQNGGEAELMRRNLQRTHLQHLVTLLTRPGNMPADAVALARDNARELTSWLQRSVQRPGLSKESRAHYADALATLQEALKASFNRVG